MNNLKSNLFSNIVTHQRFFPFKYKCEMQNECVKGKKGEWCATEIENEQDRKFVKYAF